MITALINTAGYGTHEVWPYEDGARTEFEYLSTRLRQDEAVFLLEAMPPAHIAEDAIGEWLDQVIGLLPYGPREPGLAVVCATEGPQYARVLRIREEAAAIKASGRFVALKDLLAARQESI